MPDHFVHRGHQVVGFARRTFCPATASSGDAANSSIGPKPAASVKARELPVEQETLAAVLLVDFIFVGQVVANGGHMEIAGLDNRLDGLGHGRRDALLLVLRVPRRTVLEILRVGGDLRHGALTAFASVIETKLCELPLAPRASR